MSVHAESISAQSDCTTQPITRSSAAETGMGLIGGSQIAFVLQ